MKHTKNLHIIYIITKLELGGAQKVCLSLFEGLQKQNVKTYLISGANGTLTPLVKGKPHVILLNSFKHRISLTQIWSEIKNFFHLIREIKKIKDLHPGAIVHTHSTKAGIVGRWAALFAGIKNRVHTVHGYAFHSHQNWLKWLPIYLAELFTSLITTHFVCVSSADVKTGIQLFPRFSQKHSIIRAAVNADHFIAAHKENPSPKDKVSLFIFGTVSCFKPQKNLFDLLAAFKHVHATNTNVRLELIGDGIQRPALEAWITHHQLQNAITLHGWQENVAPIMRTWNAFVLSSLWEGLPCAVVEARLLKLPVICYNTGGIHDVIIHGKNGFLIPQKDSADLADKMILLTQDTELHTSLHNHSDNFDDFTIESMVTAHNNLYRSL